MPGCDKTSGRTVPPKCTQDQQIPTIPGAAQYIVVDDVSLHFGTITAVSGISFILPRGIICGVVGSDGAGKSSLLRMIATMLPPHSGAISINGYDVKLHKSRIKKIIGYMPQRFGLYEDLTVRENIDFFMDVFGIVGKERRARRDRYLRFSNLDPFVNRLAGNLSGGMKQKLGLACVLVNQPRILILDEPTNGVDPVSRQEFWDIITTLNREGMTTLIATAYIDEADRCDQILLMHRSHLITMGAPASVKGTFPNLEEAMIHRIQEADGDLRYDSFKR